MTRASTLLLAVLLAACTSRPEAPRYPWEDRVAPAITVEVVRQADSGDYIYRYMVANGAGAEQRINVVRLFFAGPVSSISAPLDWKYMYVPERPDVLWYAWGELHPEWRPIHDADIASFASEIQPGEILAGFEIRSPCAPAMVEYVASGYNHVRRLEEEPSYREPDVDHEGIRGSVVGPGACETGVDSAG